MAKTLICFFSLVSMLVVQGNAKDRHVRTLDLDPTYSRWPRAGIPYCIEPSPAYTTAQVTTIRAAIAQIQGIIPCVTWTDVGSCTQQTYKARITPYITTGGRNPVTNTQQNVVSYSYPGLYTTLASNQSEQIVQITASASSQDQCANSQRCVLKYLALLMGMRNEHQRGDRDQTGCIALVPGALSSTYSTAYNTYNNKQANWYLLPQPTGAATTSPDISYDLCSITHNRQTDFAQTPGTNVFTVTGKCAPTGQTTMPNLQTLSYKDCVWIRSLYNDYNTATCAISTCPVDNICYPNSGTTTGTTPTFTQSSYTFTTTACTAGSTVGSVSATGATSYTISVPAQFAISSTGAITLATALAAGSYPATVTATSATGTSTAQVTITVACSTGTPTFSQPSYTLSSSACTAGTTVGSVTATGATGYTIAPPTNFQISPAGVITIGTTVAAGSYPTTVTATGTAGTATAPVTITVACGGAAGTPVFNPTSFTFTTTACTAGTTVGTVTASNAVSYSISTPAQFTISSSGGITLATALTAQAYTATVTATGTGGSATAPVSITVVCGSSSTTGTATCTPAGGATSTVSCTSTTFCPAPVPPATGPPINEVSAIYSNRVFVFSGQCAQEISATGQILGSAVAIGTIFPGVTGPVTAVWMDPNTRTNYVSTASTGYVCNANGCLQSANLPAQAKQGKMFEWTNEQSGCTEYFSLGTSNTQFANIVPSTTPAASVQLSTVTCPGTVNCGCGSTTTTTTGCTGITAAWQQSNPQVAAGGAPPQQNWVNVIATSTTGQMYLMRMQDVTTAGATTQTWKWMDAGTQIFSC